MTFGLTFQTVRAGEPLAKPAGDNKTTPRFFGNARKWILPSSLSLKLLFIVCFAAVALVWSLDSAFTRLLHPFPQSPWESQILTDAMLVNLGRPVYTLPADGHATHMYGPLITYAVAGIFRVTGYDVSVGRWIALISAALLSVGAAILLTRGASVRAHRGKLIFIGAVVFLSQFYRARAYFAESRPDAVSLLFGALAVWLFYLGQTRRARWTLLGTVALLIGFGFKQTAAVAALVPPIAALLLRPQPLGRHVFMSCVPLVTLAGCIAAIKWTLPAVYFYVIEVPKGSRIEYREVPLDILQLATLDLPTFGGRSDEVASSCRLERFGADVA